MTMIDGAGPDRGIYYLAVGWALTGVAIVVVALRLYSRILLTRSAGSDDFAIVISLVRVPRPAGRSLSSLGAYCFDQVLTVVGEIGDS